MSKRLLPILIFSFGALLASCDASFVNPLQDLGDTTQVPKIDSFALKWYNTQEHPFNMKGYVVSSHERCSDSLPPGSHIIIAWELPNYPNSVQAFVVHGDGGINPNVLKIGYYAGTFPFTLKVDSILPKSAVLFNADSSEQLAVGHLFIINTSSIKEGDTILRSALKYSDIIGGAGETGIVYQKGTPRLLGQPLTNPAVSVPGFNFLKGYPGNGPDPDGNKDMKAVYRYFPGPNSVVLFIDHDDGDTYKLNPSWLVP